MPLGIPIPDIGAISKHFSDKCYRALQENIRITLEKLSNPQDLLTLDISGALVDSVNAIMEDGLNSFDQDFVQETAQRAAVAAVDYVGAEYPDLYENVTKTINTAFNIINFAYLAYNNLVLFMMKVVARNIIVLLDSKASRVSKLKEDLIILHNILLTTRNGDPIYEEYLTQLRAAIADIIQARTRVQLVRSTLLSSNIYLSQQYESAKVFVSEALTKVRPTNTNPLLTPWTQDTGSFAGGDTLGEAALGAAEAATRPYAQTGAFLLDTAGLPNSKEQFENLVQVPVITRDIISSMRDYATIVLSINGMLSAFMAGINALSTVLNDSLTRYAADHLWRIQGDLTSIEKNMQTVLGQRSPNPAKVTTKAFEWAVRLSVTLSMMKVLPSYALGKANIAAGEIGIFESTIAALEKLDNVGTGEAKLLAEDAKENVGALETQMLPLLLKANSQIFTLTIEDSLLNLNKNLIKRMELTEARDQEIRDILQTFIDYPLAYEGELSRVMESVTSLLRKAGLDRAADLLATGDLSAFFEMNAKNASYVGAALATLAFLKDCFETEEEREKVNKIQTELESDMDLLNVEIGFNLDLRFFQNLEECLRVEGLVKMFDVEQFLCGLAEEAGIGKSFDALNDVVKF